MGPDLRADQAAGSKTLRYLEMMQLALGNEWVRPERKPGHERNFSFSIYFQIKKPE
jgi:hypothetical protein